MIKLLETYFDDACNFLPKVVSSSPMSRSVKGKVLEVMIKNLSFSPSLYGSEQRTIRILSNEPFDLGLLSEVVETLKLDYTYYKWVKADKDFELTLYKDKPKDYTRYQLQIVAFVIGYVLLSLLSFLLGCVTSYVFFIIIKGVPLEPNIPILPYIACALSFFVSFMFSTILSLISLDYYVGWFRKTSVGKDLETILEFDKLDSIGKTEIL